MHTSYRDVRKWEEKPCWYFDFSLNLRDYPCSLPLLYLVWCNPKPRNDCRFKSYTQTWVHLFLFTSAVEIFLSCIYLITLLPPFFNKDPCCHQTLHPTVDTSDRKVYSFSFLSASSSFYLPTLLSISFSTHPSLWTSTLISRHLAIDVFDDGVHCVFLSPLLSAFSYPHHLSSSRVSEIDLLFALFSLGWVNMEDSAEPSAELVSSICWGDLAGTFM